MDADIFLHRVLRVPLKLARRGKRKHAKLVPAVLKLVRDFAMNQIARMVLPILGNHIEDIQSYGFLWNAVGLLNKTASGKPSRFSRATSEYPSKAGSSSILLRSLRFVETSKRYIGKSPRFAGI